jgi:hypothetical protein
MKYSTSYGLAFGLHGVIVAFYIVAGFFGAIDNVVEVVCTLKKC